MPAHMLQEVSFQKRLSLCAPATLLGDWSGEEKVETSPDYSAFSNSNATS